MRFEKVSFEQYCKDCGYTEKFGNDLMEGFKQEYEEIKLPKRATIGSAGYDFFMPFDISLEPNETIKIPTGIRALLDNDKVLKCYPRSGLGFKYKLQLDNTVGIIDSDYSGSSNEGHIMLKITNDTRENKTLTLKQGDGFAQGIIVKFYITEDDEVSAIRNGGFGSTSKGK